MRITLHPVSIEKKKGSYETRAVPFGPNKRMHWTIRHKWTEAWKNEVFWAIKMARVAPITSVVFTLRMVKPYDMDNAVASVKALLDGIVLSGILKDDSAQYLKYLRVTPERVSHFSEEGVTIDLW